MDIADVNKYIDSSTEQLDVVAAGLVMEVWIESAINAVSDVVPL